MTMQASVTPVWLTVGGRYVDLLRLTDDDLRIEEIAHGLACINRFGGHTPVPVSVAQHSVGVACLVAPEHRRQALLHDASEAFLGDITKWLKSTAMFEGYRVFERSLQTQIYRRFGCAEELHPDVEHADRVMVRFEGANAFGPDWLVLGPHGREHHNYPRLSPEACAEIERNLGGWDPWSWQEAERRFLAAWRETT